MKLSLKELKEIRNELPTESKAFEIVSKQLAHRIAKMEIKKAKKLIKVSDQAFKSLSGIFCFKKGTLSDLNIEDNQAFNLNKLYNINGFDSIKIKRSDLGYIEYTEIKFVFDCLNEDEKKYIFDIRSKIDKTIITFI
jgi:hypothetical protein